MPDDEHLIWNPRLSTWVGTTTIGGNKNAEIEVEGGPEGPLAELRDLLLHLVPDGTQAFEIARSHLREFASLEEWYPDGARCHLSDGHQPELVVQISTEADLYGLWEVSLRLFQGHGLVARQFKRSQQ